MLTDAGEKFLFINQSIWMIQKVSNLIEIFKLLKKKW